MINLEKITKDFGVKELLFCLKKNSNITEDGMVETRFWNKYLRIDINKGTVKSSNNFVNWREIGYVNTQGGGYLYFDIKVSNDKEVTISVHKLIALLKYDFSIIELTLGEKSAFVVDHINRKKTDNRAKNLRVITRRDNTVLALSKDEIKKHFIEEKYKIYTIQEIVEQEK
ncbi:MAG: HNH endonuclease [Clostridia bacterium]